MFYNLYEVALNTKRCHTCGCTLSHISEKGRVGCADCYEVFKNELLPYIKRVHGNTKHIGKTPILENINEIKELKETLNRLIAEEKYEQAAVIRDKIRERSQEK